MRKALKPITIIFLGFIFVPWAIAYDNKKVHPTINEVAVTKSNLDSVLKQQLGIQEGIDKILIGNKTIKEWIMEGGKLEDEPLCRTKFHFHDPLKPFDEAGLYDMYHSSLVWTQDSDDSLFPRQKGGTT